MNSEHKINDVIVKELTSHSDGRGFFREIIKSSEDIFAGADFAQWSHSKMQKHVVKAWHYHHLQTDWWYIASGAVEVVLYDHRPESETYQQKMTLLAGDEQSARPLCVRIPPGVLHACEVKSEMADLFYITSHEYNPADEGRIAFDSPLVPHQWTPEAIVSDNDRRDFEPEKQRITSCK